MSIRDPEKKIPGWGVDLDPKDRPAVPKERMPARFINPHWTEPERQIPRIKIHKSTERRFMGLSRVPYRHGRPSPRRNLQWGFRTAPAGDRVTFRGIPGARRRHPLRGTVS